MLKAETVHQYARDVTAGKIVAGRRVRQACLRHLRDMERQGTPDFPYVFDAALAERFFKFSQLCRHVKGLLAGQPIVLSDFWAFVCGSLFGWVHMDTGKRRFKKGYVRVGRKNAKSTICSIIALYGLCADREIGAEIYCTATKREQAKIVFDDACAMAAASPDIKKWVKIGKSRIYNPFLGGKIEALSKDTKTLDGLNPHIAIIDEYHAHLTSEMYDVIASGMGQRAQPLLLVITTAGFSLSSPCKVEDEYAEQVIEGTLVNENYFAVIAALDSEDEIGDEAMWIKPNPLLASTEQGMEYLRGEHQMARDVPEKWRNFITKNMNMWLAMRVDGYMDMEAWERCKGVLPDDLTECVVGVDLSAKNDLTSITFEFKRDRRYYIHSHSFMPRERFERAMRQDKVPYDLWEKQGWLTVTDGAIVDYRAITAYIQEVELGRGWVIREIAFDPYNATQWATEMRDAGYVVVQIRQGIPTLGAPTSDFRDQVLAGNVVHEGDPLLSWAFSNCVTRTDANLNIMLDKSKARERIDPAAATIDAHARAMVWEEHPDINKIIKSGRWSL